MRRSSPSSRLLEATFAVVAEEGYRGMTVGMVAARAGVSRRTFYALFSDREDCFLAAFDRGLDVLAERALPAFAAEREWAARVRAGLGVLLACLDGEPALRRLVFVESLAAGPRVLKRRTQVLEECAAVIDEGRVGGEAPADLSVLTAEGVVGAVVGVVLGRVSQRRPELLVELLSGLMATIVLPYRGSRAAARELEPLALSGRRDAPAIVARRPLGSALPADFRLTVRMQMALTAVAWLSARGCNPSNLDVSKRIGVPGRGTVSLLMARLQDQGLVENARGPTKGLEKAWRLTPHGEAVIDAHRGKRASPQKQQRAGARGAKPAKRGRAGSVAERPASAGFRLTVRTHLVLTAVAEHVGASNREIAGAAGVRDEGQISRLLARLADRGLVRDTAGATAGFPKAWQLTPTGEALVHSSRALDERTP